MMKQHDFDKYLRRAQLEYPSLRPSAPTRGRFTRSVIIPVYAEEQYLDATLSSLDANPASLLCETLILLVFNHPGTAGKESIAQNIRCMTRLENELPALDNIQFGSNLFYLDIGDGGKGNSSAGVGLARKTGMDYALSIIADAENCRDRFIISLDADTLVESDYLAAIDLFFRTCPHRQAAEIAFQHQRCGDRKRDEAITRYENYIRDYARRLREAASPYAFCAMGSALVCSCEAYIRSGGMRVRQGGEDFYFLEALVKSGYEPGKIVDSCVHPSSRSSQRVPFGTGPAMEKLLGKGGLFEYADSAYDTLKEVLSLVETMEAENIAGLPSVIAEECPAPCVDFFMKNNFPAAWTKIVANSAPDVKSLRRAFHRWFDALKTQQLLRTLSTSRNS